MRALLANSSWLGSHFDGILLACPGEGGARGLLALPGCVWESDAYRQHWDLCCVREAYWHGGIVGGVESMEMLVNRTEGNFLDRLCDSLHVALSLDCRASRHKAWRVQATKRRCTRLGLLVPGP